MSYSLIVIDMQEYFEAACDTETQRACKKAIRKAMKDNATILLVEYRGCGRTAATLAGLVDGYKNAHVVKKSDDNGGYEVVRKLRKKRLPRSTLRICGVNTDACVEATVYGIKKNMKNRLPEIQVLADACNSCENHRRGLRSLKEMGAKIIVPKNRNKHAS